MRSDLFNKILFLVLNMSIFCPLFVNGQLPDFTIDTVVTGLFGPVSGAILPDNRMLVIFQNGSMQISSDLDIDPVSMSTYMTLPDVNGTAEHGLIEIILDPEFETNNFFYLHYAVYSSSVDRLSRFTHNVDTGSVASEFILWETPEMFSGCCHMGGAITFLPDSTILFGVGDDFQPTLAQDLTSSRGKLHRINRDGTTPTDNPYYDGTVGPYNANGEVQSIYAHGLRNPFRGAYDSVNDRFFIGEVGGNDHAASWEDVHEAEENANYGWPFCGETGREPDGTCTDPVYTDPIFTYPHSNVGASITAGIFYNGSNYPQEWQGRFFYADWVRSWIRYLDFDINGDVIADEPFIDQNILGGAEALTVTKMLQGLNGEVYYFSMFEDFVNYTGGIHRIKYTGPMPPECMGSSSTPSTGPGPSLGVTLSANAYDANGDSLLYIWDPGDGSPVDTGQMITHTYGWGTFFPFVTVSDSDSAIQCEPLTISVGAEVQVNIKVFLEGPLDLTTSLMHDELRVNGIIPTTEPFTTLGFDHFGGGGGESFDPVILDITGSDAIVDWLFLELRDMNDSRIITYTRSVLVQRDGDMVDMDGTSSVKFVIMEGDHYIAVRHRNHLGFMTLITYPLSTSTPLTIDLTDGSTPTFGTDGQTSEVGVLAMWSGNCTLDTVIKYTGVQNDRDPILSRIGGVVPTAVVEGYFNEDNNLDGLVKYTGWKNDRDVILHNIGGNSVLATKEEQLP